MSTVIVCKLGSGDFTTIAAALEAVGPGGRIRVKPGCYIESLSLEFPVEIVGEGPVGEVIIMAAGDVITSTAEWGLVYGVSLRQAGGGPHSALVVRAGQLRVEKCTINSASRAASVWVTGRKAQPTLHMCHFEHGVGSGIIFTQGAGGMMYGCTLIGHDNPQITARHHADPHIERCAILRGRSNGVVFLSGAKGKLLNCHIRKHGASQVVVANAAPKLRECVITAGRSKGVAFLSGARGSMHRCTIQLHRHAHHPAVLLEKGSAAQIGNCTITFNVGCGVWASRGAKGAVMGCRLWNNGKGAWFYEWGAAVSHSSNAH
jgi:F-box protein 11